MHALSEKSFLRLPQIIGDPKKGIDPLIPVSRSTWWAGCKSGKFPKPVHISKRISAWRSQDIYKLLEKFSK